VRVRIRGRDHRSHQGRRNSEPIETEPDLADVDDGIVIIGPVGSRSASDTDRGLVPRTPDGVAEIAETGDDPISVADELYEDVSAVPEGEPPAGGPSHEPEAASSLDMPAAASDEERGGAESHPRSETGAYMPRSAPRVLAVANQKGGVGKTTTAVNLGAGLAEIGFRVLVIDLDPQGNATTGLGIDGRTFDVSMYDVVMRDAKLEDAIEPTSLKNLFVAPATIDLAGAEIELVPTFSRELKLRRALESVMGDFDYILIDCPPSLGLITVNGLAAADEVLVPIQCEYYALEGLGQLLRNVHLVQANLNDKLEVTTIVLTMYDGRTKLAEQVADEVRAHFGSKVCRSVIPRTVRISEAPSFGQPITTFDPTSRGAIAYRELAKEVSGGAS
jgi:chromosome partitioning protein